MDVEDAQARGSRQRFATRVVLMEEVSIVEQLQRVAFQRGSTISGEIRAAVRYYLAALGPEEDEGEP